MLITMPYLTIKHEQGYPADHLGGKEIWSLLTKAEVTVRQIKYPKMCEHALVCCQRPALLCTHLQTGSNTNRRLGIIPRDAKNQVCQEQVPSRTSRNGPTVTHCQEQLSGIVTNWQESGPPVLFIGDQCGWSLKQTTAKSTLPIGASLHMTNRQSCNHPFLVQPDTNKSQPASIELPNGTSNVDGKRWTSTSVKEVGVERQCQIGG